MCPGLSTATLSNCMDLCALAALCKLFSALLYSYLELNIISGINLFFSQLYTSHICSSLRTR